MGLIFVRIEICSVQDHPGKVGGGGRGAGGRGGWWSQRGTHQLLTFPSGSWMNAWFSSCRHSPSTMNLYWWYPGGRLHTTANTCAPEGVGSGAIGTVSSQLVKDPHRCTCASGSGTGGMGERVRTVPSHGYARRRNEKAQKKKRNTGPFCRKGKQSKKHPRQIKGRGLVPSPPHGRTCFPPYAHTKRVGNTICSYIAGCAMT